jgi:hypothetical protein
MSWRMAIEKKFAGQAESGPVLMRCIPNISLLSSGGGMNIWLNEGRCAKLPSYNRNETLQIINETFKRERQIKQY